MIVYALIMDKFFNLNLKEILYEENFDEKYFFT